jgi:hypothetical protein
MVCNVLLVLDFFEFIQVYLFDADARVTAGKLPVCEHFMAYIAKKPTLFLIRVEEQVSIQLVSYEVLDGFLQFLLVGEYTHEHQAAICQPTVALVEHCCFLFFHGFSDFDFVDFDGGIFVIATATCG